MSAKLGLDRLAVAGRWPGGPAEPPGLATAQRPMPDEPGGGQLGEDAAKGRLLRIGDWEKLAMEARFQPATMAAFCHISIRQMQRFFAERFNTRPGAWARELRCRLAARLISEGQSNKAVASDLGFCNESHLCHEFRRVYGFSPQTFAPPYRLDGGPQRGPSPATRQVSAG